MLSITPQNQLLSRKDSNLNSLDQNQMCCRYTTGQFIVGAIGLEPMNSKEGGFTVRSNCRYATLPFARLKGFEPITTGFGDQDSTN